MEWVNGNGMSKYRLFNKWEGEAFSSSKKNQEKRHYRRQFYISNENNNKLHSHAIYFV
jgi:hypothetical protein